MTILNKHIRNMAISVISGVVIVSSGFNSYALRSHNIDNSQVDIPSIISIDEKTGDILYARNENLQRPIASLTKSMTLLLTLEAIDSGKISETDIVHLDKTPDSWGSRFYLEKGDSYSVKDLMDMIMIISANDACVVLGEYISGSVDAFVDKMNEKAKELGMNDTLYKNPNGLPLGMEYGADPGNLSTAKDLAFLVKYIMNNYGDRVSRIVSSQKLDLKGMDAPRYNSNKLLFRDENYKGYEVNGFKTGFTNTAMHCLITTSTHYNNTLKDKSDDFDVVSVSLGGKSREYRYDEHTKLLNVIQADYKKYRIADINKPVINFNLYTKDKYNIKLLPQRNLDILVEKKDLTKDGINYVKDVNVDGSIKYPIKKGQVVGTVTYTNQSKKDISYTVNLVADRNTPNPNIIDKIFSKK